MNTDQLKVILERIESVQKVVNRIDNDLATDREDLQDFRVRLKTLEEQVAELRKALRGQSEKIQDKVEEAVQPMLEEAQDLRKTIKSKRTMVIREKSKSLWNKIFGRKD